MKKIILITIICFSIPCFVFAQGHATISSIEGTLWGGQATEIYVNFVTDLHVETITRDVRLGFSDGMMYYCEHRSGGTCTPQRYIEEGYPTGSMVIMDALGLAVISVRQVDIGTFFSHHLFVQTLPWGVGYFYRSTMVFLLNEPKLGSGFIMSYSQGKLERESADWSP